MRLIEKMIQKINLLDRRCFLSVSAIALLIAKTPALAHWGVRSHPGSFRSRSRHVIQLGKMFRDLNAATSIGRCYLAQHPQEADAVWLDFILFGNAHLANVVEIRGHMAAKRQEEFLNNEIVVLERWIFARCEARACALISVW